MKPKTYLWLAALCFCGFAACVTFSVYSPYITAEFEQRGMTTAPLFFMALFGGMGMLTLCGVSIFAYIEAKSKDKK